MGNKLSKKFPVYFYVIALSIPFSILLTMEILLWYFDFGVDYKVFTKLDKGFDDFLFFNPKLPQKYFSSDVSVPSVIPDGFLKEKRKNGFRIFVLGESSVAGFPYPPNASFPRFIKRKLELYYPEKFIEVINLGVSAINSHTLADIVDDIIEQKPDLILIYTGHNEYYGAFGAAINKSLLANKIVIRLKNFRSYQMLDKLIGMIAHMFSKSSEEGKTLMAAMAADKLILRNSAEYRNGIEFFNENMKTIFDKFNQNNIPVISSTLISNEMQKPLENSVRISTANKYFESGMKFYDEGKYQQSKSLLQKAIDEDAVRFRAPKEINKAIRIFHKRAKTEIVDAENYFRSLSESGILENNYFVDHLHLSIESNRKLADLFIDKILKSNLLPKSKRIEKEAENMNKLLDQNIPFTGLDSSYSSYSIEVLKNTFPFTKNTDAEKILNQFIPQNSEDSLALQIIRKEISWDNAHLKLALGYFRKKNFTKYYNEMNALIEDKPFEKANYYNAVNLLMSRNQNYLAFPILKKLEHRFPDLFCYKKLSDIYFESRNLNESLKYLLSAERLNSNDAEIYFKLSRIYYLAKDFNQALSNIKRCIDLKPDYPNAANIYEMLQRNVNIK